MSGGSVSDGNVRRLRALQRLTIGLGKEDFDRRYDELTFAPVVALICAYEEELNIADVVAKVPSTACGLEVSTLVVVDGGEDATAEVAEKAGATTFVLPTNLGHGVALRVGYELCIERGATYVVTLDADGQNDPSELPDMLQPLVSGEADFVVGSRRLGIDHTSDRYRQLGVVCFSLLLRLLTGKQVSDTSNGYRALTTDLLRDVVGRLEQDQYQTSELLVTAISRGWRVVDRPTVWYERASGRSKKGGNMLYGLRYARVMTRTWWRERRSAA